MAQGAWKDWSEGELVTEALFQDIQDSIAFIYASESAANTALTRKVEGTQFYDTGEDKLKIWNGSAWDAVAGGKVLQVVSGTDSSETSTTSSSYVDSGLSASITPSATSSKILIIATHNIFAQATDIPGISMNIVRGTTVIQENKVSAKFSDSVDNYMYMPLVLQFLDSPNTTSATTYKTQLKEISDGDCATPVDGQVNNILLMEIGA
jgi:hypothetical protein